MSSNQVILRVEALNKSFGGLQAVRDLSLEISAHKVTGLIGPNGAGKTTFFNLVSGIYSADSGKIVFWDERIDSLKPHQIAQAGITRTFQTLNNFPRLSVFENVRAGIITRGLPLEQEETEVYKMLQLLGISDLAASGVGEITPEARRLVEVGRALIARPKLVLFDEIMAGFSEQETVNLIGIIGDYARRGTTFCIVGHTMRAIMSVSDELIVMHEGTKFEQGTPAQIQASRAVHKIYLGESTDDDPSA